MAQPVVVVTDSEESIDRVEVARRGGRGFLPRSLTVAGVSNSSFCRSAMAPIFRSCSVH